MSSFLYEVVFLIGFRQAILGYWRGWWCLLGPLFSSLFPNLICPSNPHSILPPERWVIKADGNEVTHLHRERCLGRETCSPLTQRKQERRMVVLCRATAGSVPVILDITAPVRPRGSSEVERWPCFIWEEKAAHHFYTPEFKFSILE